MAQGQIHEGRTVREEEFHSELLPAAGVLHHLHHRLPCTPRRLLGSMCPILLHVGGKTT